jgi:hypothetical protein
MIVTRGLCSGSKICLRVIGASSFMEMHSPLFVVVRACRQIIISAWRRIMKVGDLVRFYGSNKTRGTRGCLPSVEDNRWTDCGLVQEVCNNGNVNILWPGRGLELVATYFLEIVSENR